MDHPSVIFIIKIIIFTLYILDIITFSDCGIPRFIESLQNDVQYGVSLILKTLEDLGSVVSLLTSLTAGLPACLISSISIIPAADITQAATEVFQCIS